MKITRTSIMSGTIRSRDFDITPEQWAAYERGDLIQRAFPHLSDADREFILTGITDEEWDECMSEDEDDITDDDPAFGEGATA